ncbi:MAG: ABC transporter substrate-binding protein [bacterium]|nr:ABC transporter substrate-binding protein [bacterium]
MKKVFGLVMLVALLVATFGSIAVSAQDAAFTCPEGEATIRVGGGSVGAEREVGEEQAARYMELCPNITVEFVDMPDSTTDRLGIYQQLWEQQSGDIDVYQVDVIWAGIIAEHVVDLNEYLSEEEIAQYFPAMIEGQTIDGRLVAIPFFTDAAGLYYRTDLLEKYGVEVPTTWEELTVAAQTIQDGERAEGNTEFYGYVWQGNAYEGLTCDAHEWLVSETGATFVTPDGEVNVTSDAWLAALDRAAGWVGTISPEAVTTYQEEESRATWQAGNAAFMRNWPYAYNLGNGEGSAVAGNFGYAPLPMGASQAAACLGGWQLAVSAYSANVEAAASVARFFTSYDEQLNRALGPTGSNPTIPALYETPELSGDALFSAMGPILSTAFPRPSGVTADRYAVASELFYTAVHGVLTGEASAEDAMEELEADLQDLVAEMAM